MKKDFEKLSREVLAQFRLEDVTKRFGEPTHEVGREIYEMVSMKDGVQLNTRVMFPGAKNAGVADVLPEPLTVAAGGTDDAPGGAADVPPELLKGGTGGAGDVTGGTGGTPTGATASQACVTPKYPAVLIRNPYVALADGSLYRFYNLYGYAVVYQEVRGKGKSGGVFEAWDHERDDGIDTVRWIQNQDWYNGELYLVGSSYTAFVHMTMLDEIMSDVKGAVLRVFTPDFRRALYENGVWHLDMITPWVINMENDFMDDQKFSDKYMEALAIRPFDRAVDTVLGKEFPWHQQMVLNPKSSSNFWSHSHWANMCTLPEKMEIPVLLIDGWYDPFCPGLLRMWDQMPRRTREKSAMIIGPWVHDCVIQEGCEFPLPDGEILGVDGSLGFLDWLNHVRFGTKPVLCEPGKVRYYVCGSGEWKDADTFNYIKMPDGRKPYSGIKRLRFYLDENALVEKLPKSRALAYDYMPEKPDSFRGGEYYNNFMPGGIMRQAKPFKRKSILNFISNPLKEDIELAGYVDIFLEVTSDCEETVFIARLDAVNEAGAWNVRESASLMSRGVVLKNDNITRAGLLGTSFERNPDTKWVHLRMWPCAWHLKAGWQLRLDIASSNFPAYLPHGNVDQLWSQQTQTKHAHNTIFTGRESFIEMSVKA